MSVNPPELRGGLNLVFSFLEQLFLKVIHNSIKHCLKIILTIKTHNCIKRLFTVWWIIDKYKIWKTKNKHDFSIRCTSARINSSAKISKRYSLCYILFVLVNGRIRFNRKRKSKFNAWETYSKEAEIHKTQSFVSISSWK